MPVQINKSNLAAVETNKTAGLLSASNSIICKHDITSYGIKIEVTLY